MGRDPSDPNSQAVRDYLPLQQGLRRLGGR